MLYDEMAKSKGRPLTESEMTEADQMLIDRETLYLYSRQIGLQRDPIVQRRLAQIASFVSENPHEAERSAEEGARTAEEEGIMDGDLISRRIMIDAARRLIRATALVFQPDDEAMQEYLTANAERFQQPGLTRITHVALTGWRRADPRADAVTLLARLTSENIAPEEAIGLGDETVLSPELALLPDSSLERRFGRAFVKGLAGLPSGSWQGPIRSRVGEHLVFILERVPPRTATLGEARDQVSSAMRNENADRVLRARLDELQEVFDVRVQRPPS